MYTNEEKSIKISLLHSTFFFAAQSTNVLILIFHFIPSLPVLFLAEVVGSSSTRKRGRMRDTSKLSSTLTNDSFHQILFLIFNLFTNRTVLSLTHFLVFVSPHSAKSLIPSLNSFGPWDGNKFFFYSFASLPRRRFFATKFFKLEKSVVPWWGLRRREIFHYFSLSLGTHTCEDVRKCSRWWEWLDWRRIPSSLRWFLFFSFFLISLHLVAFASNQLNFWSPLH